MLVMANNLDAMIRRAGMTNKEVAEEKGIKPETLSRHKSGAIQISRADADEYAKILGCLPQQIFYNSAAIPLLGTVEKGFMPVRDRTTYWDYDDDCINSIFLNAYYHQWTVALKWCDEIEGTYSWMCGGYTIYDYSVARFNKIDDKAFMKPCLAKERGTHRLFLGDLYPLPGKKNRFTIFNDGEFPVIEDVDIEWAAPLIECVTRPDLRGVEEVCFPKAELEGFYVDYAPSIDLPD